MLQKIKIGTRLALAFAVLLLLISALAAGGISGAKRLTERSAALYGDRTVPLGVLAEISHLTQRNRVLVMDMLMDPGTSNLQASHAALTANVERIHTLWTAYSGKALGSEEQGLAQAFADANATYLDKGLIPAASALVAGKYDDGSELYINQIRPNAAKVQDAIEKLVALQINVAAAEFAGAREMSNTIHWWMLAATGLALVAGAAMAWVITRSISRPLRPAGDEPPAGARDHRGALQHRNGGAGGRADCGRHRRPGAPYGGAGVQSPGDGRLDGAAHHHRATQHGQRPPRHRAGPRGRQGGQRGRQCDARRDHHHAGDQRAVAKGHRHHQGD